LNERPGPPILSSTEAVLDKSHALVVPVIPLRQSRSPGKPGRSLSGDVLP